MEMYDVFISFKNTDDAGRPTRDAVMAEALYRALKKKGINAFFSKYSIDESARADYVEAIDEALESAAVFVAVGTSKKNLTSGWVKHEINQFRTLMNAKKGKERSIASYRSADYSSDDLPSGLACYQSYADQTSVVRFVEACIKKASGFRADGDHTQLLYHNHDVTFPPLANLATDSSNHGLQIGSVLDDRYEILRLIGKGGMSYVYLALDRRICKQYAVKEIRSDSVVDFGIVLDGLRFEVNLMKQLSHPAIPKIYDIIENGNSFIVVMEYVEGENLNNVLAQHGPMDEKQLLSIARQLGQVLDFLHDRPTPIIYRDLKPSNIMLKPDGTVKLIDFGVAREYKKFAFGDTTLLGTVGYAAPEQFGGMGQTDARTDIYNLGATLYQLVTGRNPAEPPYEILPIRQVNSNLSRGLESIIKKCTQKDPGQRFQSAMAFLAALDNLEKLDKLSLFTSFFHKPVSGANHKTSSPRQEKTQVPIPDKTTKPDNRMPQSATPTNQCQSTAPLGEFSVPGSPSPISGSRTPPTPTPQEPSLLELLKTSQKGTDIYTAPTEPLIKNTPIAPPGASKTVTPPVTMPPSSGHTTPDFPFAIPDKEKTKIKKVSVRTKPSANTARETEDVLAKFLALDPKSQQLVRDLIDRLSQ